MQNPSKAGEPKRKIKYYERRKLLDVIGRVSTEIYCRYVPMASREFTPLECTRTCE